jgi:phospholipase/lecithinase/hemolysin
MADRSDLLWDGVHPTPDGATLIATTIYDAHHKLDFLAFVDFLQSVKALLISIQD